MLAIFDEEIVMENYEGLPEVLMIDGLESYCSEGTEYMGELLKSNDEDAHRIAHSVKTMSRMVGAMRLGQMCETYEKSQGQCEYSKQDLIKEFNEVKIQIETYVASLKYA